MKNKKITLYVVIPCYNEEELLGETTKRLKIKLENLKDLMEQIENLVMFVGLQIYQIINKMKN